jgi:hypothetical protein
VLLPLSTQAAEMPKEGADSFTNAFIATFLGTIQQGSQSFTVYEINGVARNDAGAPMFNMFGQRCVGMQDGLGGKYSDRGTCTYTDPDRDNIFMPYRAQAEAGLYRGTYEVAGGTGKFAGITGSGALCSTRTPIKADDKWIRHVMSNKVTWKLS